VRRPRPRPRCVAGQRHGVDTALVRANEIVKQMRVAGEDGGYDLRLVRGVGDSGHRFSIASRGSVIVCIMLEPWVADWLREIGRFLLRGWVLALAESRHCARFC
jgi:hypothetical protein